MSAFDKLVELADDDWENVYDIPADLLPLLLEEIEADLVPYDKTIGMIDEYFGLTVHKESLKAMFKEQPRLAFEAYTGGVTDTCVRDSFADLIATHYGFVDGWPINGSSREYKDQFRAFLPQINEALSEGKW